MQARRLTATAVAALLVGGVAPSVGAEADVRMTNQITRVDAAPGIASAPVLSFVARSSVSAPSGPETVTDYVVGDTARLDPAGVPGVDRSVPYSMRFRATALAAGSHATQIAVRQGFGNEGWISGVIAPGSDVADGEYVESVVSNELPTPALPPRPATSGGTLAWEPVNPQSYVIASQDWNPEAGAFDVHRVATASAAATLRVDGGDFVATEDTTTELVVPLPGWQTGIVFTSRQTRLPDLSYSYNQSLVDTAEGRAMRIRVTIPAGARWPQSGDEGPAGSWKLRIAVNAADFTSLDAAADAGGGVLAELGADGPGTQATYMIDGGEPVELPSAVRTVVEATREGVELVDALRWPALGDGPALESAGHLELSAEGCHQTHGVSAYQASGALSICLSEDGLADAAVNGTDIGSFGLPYVDVNGTAMPVEWVGGSAPAVREHAYWIAADNYGSQLNVLMHGRAGGVFEFDALFILTATDDGATVLPLLLEYRNETNAHGDARFGWLIDSDAGAGEEFALHGSAPLAAESVFASDGLSGVFGAQPAHVVRAPGSPVIHRLTPWATTDLVAFRRDSLLPSVPEGGSPELAALPPEPLLDADVATYAVTHHLGSHAYWYSNRSPAVTGALGVIPREVPWGVAFGLGVVAAGQTGLTWFVSITGV